MTTDHTNRATTSQRAYIPKLLKRQGLAITGRCSAQWRPLFKLIGRAEPLSPFDWPNAEDVIYELTVVQASALINYLLGREA